MMMNTLIGKTMAIWMLAGRPLAAGIFFLVGFLRDWVPALRRAHQEGMRAIRRKPVYTYVHDEPVKPKGEYRLGK